MNEYLSGMDIPVFPQTIDLSLEVSCDLRRILGETTHGISEFTFAGLYLFRHHYDYRIARTRCGRLVVSGVHKGRRFFSLPCGFPESSQEFLELMEVHDYLKNASESDMQTHGEVLKRSGFDSVADRDNFDYLYRAADLAELPGKKLHKKRNHVNGFLKQYSHEVRPLDEQTMPDALVVLDAWREERDEDGDYRESREALTHFAALGLSGMVVYVNNSPVACALGEPLVADFMYVVHVEKAVAGYRGVYQFVNKAFAEQVSRRYEVVNREQDLGEPGIRQAKMTYRPCGFVEKYRIAVAGSPDLAVPTPGREVVGCAGD